ncbi:MAG: DNA recombination protein RmuC [Tetrasphaera sp.]|nr:DNA recombination protein RmuC [Tetrasphaera sp.]
MEISLTIAVVVALVAAALAVLTTRLVYAARLAGALAERDVLRERVIDLESSLGEDLETATLLAPLKEALTRVESQVGTLERDRVEQFGSLRAVLSRVEGETQELGRATARLAGSLQSSSVRGAWGEVQLRRVLELSGMLARCDFEEQVSAVGHDGRGVRPDVVVRLPGGRCVVIDAKAPMAAFLHAQDEDLDDAERSQLLRDHARSLRSHVEALSRKDYSGAFTGSADLVVCFVPGDAILGAALSADPGLHEWALERAVALVGPAALLALLRTVASLWQQQAVAESATEVVTLGQELYRRLATLGGHTARLGRSLHGAVESYNAAVGALESRVLVSARRMHDLGLVGSLLDAPTPIDITPRPLTAQELIDAATAEDARAELDLDWIASHPRVQRGDEAIA